MLKLNKDGDLVIPAPSQPMYALEVRQDTLIAIEADLKAALAADGKVVISVEDARRMQAYFFAGSCNPKVPFLQQRRLRKLADMLQERIEQAGSFGAGSR